MIDRHALSQRLDTADGNELITRIKAVLDLEETRVVSNRSSKVSVSEALRLWSTRLQNTDLTGQNLEGADSLLNELRRLAKNRKLEQVAFIGSAIGGNVFFRASSPHDFLGAVVFSLPREDASR